MQKYPQDLPHSKDILSIQKFKLLPEEIKQIYPKAYALPEFLIDNLVSPLRVVKCFTGKFALVEAFYFQLMKLALEIDVDDINYRDIIYNKFVLYDFFEEGELEDQIFNDFQYRKFMKDFIEKVEADDIPNFQKTAEHYSIINQILNKYFHLILPYPLLMNLNECTSHPKDTARQVLTFLGSEFSITVQQIQQCFKLEQSDMFIYFQSLDQVYLAYDDQYLQIEKTTSFTSSIQCGVDNSFVTKYHSTNKQTRKPSETGIQISQINTNQKQTKSLLKRSQPTHFEHQVLMEQSKPYSDNACTKNQQKLKNTPKMNYYQPTEIGSSQNSNSSQFLNLQKQNKQNLYKQFTSSFIVEQLSPSNRQQVKMIKNRYFHKRESIKSFL